jgi:hypothetical protein
MPREKPAPAEVDPKALSDAELLRRLAALLGQSRRVEADLIAHIAEVDIRRLYAREAFPSMFAYATGTLHLSEGEAYARIAVARAALQHPVLLAKLRDGHLHLSGIVKLLPHLTKANRASLLARAEHKTKRQIEELIAELAPQPDVPATMWKLPEARPRQPTGVSPPPATAETAATPRPGHDARDEAPLADPGPGHHPVPVKGLASPSARDASPPAATATRPAAIEPLAPARYKIQLTASAALHAKLERLQALMRASAPEVDLATVIEQAVTEKLDRLEARRFGRSRAPRKELEETDTSATSRYVPAPVRRTVYARDGGQCCYLDERGRRCPERHNLEFHHHETAFGRGGDHHPAGLRLMCRVHNALLAEEEYGVEHMMRYRRPGGPGQVRESLAGYFAVPRLRGAGPTWPAGGVASS